MGADHPGTTPAPSLLAGRFRLGELLGTGGSASVFAADDTQAPAGSDSAVALKILHPHLAARPAACEAFIAEARRAAPLRHPNIVRVRGFGVDDTAGDPLVWIALERAAGLSLAEHVASHGPLAVADAVAMIDGALRGLEAAHAIGLIHRDVSPANIMAARGAEGLTSDGAQLLDFGLADAAGKAALGTEDLLNLEPTGRAGVIGNVHYMSPEQAQGLAVDERSDVYQAGAVLYFALTGRPPFPRESSAEAMRAHLTTPPPVPSVIDPRIPRGLDRVVVRAMLKDPADRFLSADSMRSAIAELGIVSAASVAPADTMPAAVMDSAAGEAVTAVIARTVVLPREEAKREPTRRAARRPRRRPRALGHSRSAGGWIAGLVVTALLGSSWALAAMTPPATGAADAPAPTLAAAAASPTPPSGPRPRQPSAAPAGALVPALHALTLEEARHALEQAGLQLGEITIQNSELNGDTVLSFSPAAGAPLPLGGLVSVVVASGSNTVPAIMALPEREAQSRLQLAGFAAVIIERADASAAPGTVVQVTPSPQSVLRLGSEVTIVVAKAAATPTPVPTTSPTPTPSPEPGTSDTVPTD